MISNCGIDERGKINGGRAGDQTGKEYWVRSWYNGGWNVILRPNTRAIGDRLAKIARAAAENNHVGYDQGQRTTYYKALKSVNWKPENITVDCEADCSASTSANIIATGYQLDLPKLKAFSASNSTRTLRNACKSIGFEVLTESKYLTSSKYLLPGDILLKEGTHVAINLDTGSAVKGKDKDPVEPEIPVEEYIESDPSVLQFKKYLNGFVGAKIPTETNRYDVDTRNAALKAWKTIANRKLDAGLNPGNSNFLDKCRRIATDDRMKVPIANDKDLNKICQGILAAKGFYTGAIDGIIGEKSIKAIKKIQRDGVIGPEGWSILFSYIV